MSLRASVAVITYNSGETIRDCLCSILNQDIPRSAYEVLVVDSGSTDGTAELVRTKQNVRLIIDERKGRGLARNVAIRNAKSDIVVFIDADCVAARDWLRTHIEVLNDKKMAALGGAVLFPPQSSWLIRTQHHLYFGGLERKKNAVTWDLATCNISFLRQPLEKIGFFDDTVHQGEDTLLCWKLVENGYEVGFHPGPKVMHLYKDMTLSDFLRLKRRDGSTDYNLQLLFSGKGPYRLPTGRVSVLLLSPLLFTARVARYASKVKSTAGVLAALGALGHLILASGYWVIGYLGASRRRTR
ncbi:MAG: glycosyltransferase [Thaumarchaeota archaeon]|nr:glycosyltransferase [Nitrososphaerota archaeon]MCL5317479.1 glycosyltransferase [Nitrososphaerota archaeon]